ALMELPVPPETLGRLGGEIARQMLKAAEDYVAGLAAGQAISGFRSALAIPAGPPEASQGALPSRTSRTGRTPETGVVSGSPVGHGNSGGPAGIPQVAPAEGGETAGSDGHGASSDSGPAPGVSSSPS
ncbi:MAG: hypothetical protein HYY08_03320, partial [Firmicutes bacterium]|nr:hypothetical protein [Bacillota bacterium]